MVMAEEKQAIVFVRDEISELILLVATEKGAFLYYSDSDRRHWDVNGPHFLGSVVHHLVLDPRDNKTLMASVQSRQSGVLFIGQKILVKPGILLQNNLHFLRTN